uniref:Odorant-binding protein 57e n=1 Tax=Drosophila ficusphila TaxID=30025 RepID=B0M2E5_DROFC|nr:odorant-binding protein 57e [Drosophila ficusphila]
MFDRQALFVFITFWCGIVHANSALFNPCISRQELTLDEATQVLDHWPSKENLSSIDRNYKCFLTCVLLDLELISANGEVQIDKYTKLGVIDWKWVATELVSCRAKYVDEKDLCELAFGLFNCFRELKLSAEKKPLK